MFAASPCLPERGSAILGPVRNRNAGFVAGLCSLVLVTLAAWWWARSGAPIRVSIVEPPARDEVPAAAGGAPRSSAAAASRPPAVSSAPSPTAGAWPSSPDESRVALIRSDAIELVDARGAAPSVRIPPYGAEAPEEMGDGTYMGVRVLARRPAPVLSAARTAARSRARPGVARRGRTIPIDGGGFQDSFVGDFVLDRAGTRIYALDQFNYRLVTIDCRQRDGAAVGARRAQSRSRSRSRPTAGRRGSPTSACSSTRCCPA